MKRILKDEDKSSFLMIYIFLQRNKKSFVINDPLQRLTSKNDLAKMKPLLLYYVL